jgi:hypothetical protein
MTSTCRTATLAAFPRGGEGVIDRQGSAWSPTANHFLFIDLAGLHRGSSRKRRCADEMTGLLAWYAGRC